MGFVNIFIPNSAQCHFIQKFVFRSIDKYFYLDVQCIDQI